MEHQESKRFSKRVENFTCEVCGAEISGTGYTDHCPNCLWSKHVDINPGDRLSKCGGMMKPIKTEHNRTRFFIEYRCEKCKMKKRVQVAKDDNKERLELLGS